MRVHYLQHVPHEDLDGVEGWLRARGAAISATRFYANEPLPALEAVDWLIAMGGPMSVNDEAKHPWLVTEKAFIREAITAGKTVLGICLGSQLIASALGAKVRRAAEPEIGWWPVNAVEKGSELFPSTFEVLHWHYETFDLPSGAELLASSAACEHQAFRIGPRVLALQFHPEMSVKTVRAILAHEVPAPGRYVQPGEEILREAKKFERAGEVLGRVLECLGISA